MQLIKLELYGFKSFSNKTEFSFSPGITAFVGPNGCGKSNVVDAIRWVLGEQNPRALRANKMEDLVYAGSENSEHKNYAEVSIVLDNSDNEIPLEYREVTVSRRYYRSGDSEYFINRVPCRLKDISDILASSSLGRGTYSIIGQGQVEEVVNSRPEDRRLMFEEAAGIALYKMRKREALKKLGNTRAHLVRIEDIVHELRDQEGDIRESAANAKEYLEHKDQADKVEKSLWAARYFDLEKRLKGLAERRLELETSKTQCQIRAEAVEQQYTTATVKMQECADLINAMEQGRAQLIGNKTELDYQLQLSEQRQLDYQNMVMLAQQKLARLKAQAEETEGGMKQLQQTIGHFARQISRFDTAGKLRGDAAGLVRRLLAAAEQYCAQADNIIMQTAIDSTEHGESRDKARESEAELAGQLGTVREELNEWKQAAAKIQDELKSLTLTHTDIDREYQQVIASEAKILQELADMEETLSRKNSGKLELEKSIAANRQKLDMLSIMEQELHGFNAGTRAILKAGQDSRLRGVLGAVADMFVVEDQRYSLALETALGGALQYVICQDEECCRQAIDFLKRTGAGRATFVPISAAEERQHGSRPQVFTQPVLGWADQLIQCSEKLKPVASMLLGNVLVTESLATATKLAVEIKYRYKIVTLEGEVISRGLFTGGGNARSGHGLLQRKAQAEELGKEISRLEQKLAELGSETEQTQAEYDGLLVRKAAIDGAKETKEKELFRVQTQLEQVNSQAEQIEARVGRSNGRIQELEQKIAEARSYLAGIVSRIDRDKAGLELMQTTKLRFQGIEDKLRELVSIWASRQNSLDLTIYSLQNKQENQKRHLQSLQEQHEELLKQTVDLDSENRRNQEQNNGMLEKIAQTRIALQEVEAGLNSVAASLDGQEGIRVQIKADIDNISRETAQLREEYNNINNALHEAEVKAARWQTEAEAMVRELTAQFGISPQEGLSYLDSRYSTGELSAMLKRFRARMEEMGEINLASISQHQKLIERLEFLEGQQADLARAEQDILDLVGELDKTIRELFMDTFQQVQEYFSEIFKILFGGGSAYLSLCDQDDLLETGIEIFARPPGKRMQSLSLLSGGEKSMTAIALLFALQSVRPSPFCILDEIEAALDDLNILRFSQYLRQLSENMQFILITHRRETMENSDSLYGITLARDGGSQPISVVLSENTG